MLRNRVSEQTFEKNSANSEANNNPQLRNDNSSKSRNPSAGVILAASSALLFSLLRVSIKVLRGVPLWQIGFIQNCQVAFLAYCAILLDKNSTDKIQFRQILRRSGWKLALRGFLGTSAMMLGATSARFLPLGDALAINSTSTILVTLIAWLYLKERVSRTTLLCILLTIIGSIMVAKPQFLFPNASSANTLGGNNNRVLGISAALGGAVIHALLSVSGRAMRGESPNVMLMFGGISAALICLVMSLFFGSWVSDSKWWLPILAVGLISFAAQYTMTSALRSEKANVVSLVRSSEILWGYIWQIFIFHETPDGFSIFGTLLILSGVVLMALNGSSSGPKVQAARDVKSQ